MSNAGFRSDLYNMFTEENLASWSQELDAETASQFAEMVLPLVYVAPVVSIQESTSTLNGKAITAGFPGLEELQIKCAALGLPVTLPESYSQYVD